jgi:hypothetical protein
MKGFAQRLGTAHIKVIAGVFAFWALQAVAWVCMMCYVQFFPNHLKNSILYTIQISHWALVITCGTAATAAWGIISLRLNAAKLEANAAKLKELHEHVTARL